MSIIRRKYRTYATPGISHSIHTDDCLAYRAIYRPAYQTVNCVYRVTNTRCRIGTVFSPDDGHIAARNLYRKAINLLRKSVHQVGSIYKVIQGARSKEHERKTYFRKDVRPFLTI